MENRHDIRRNLKSRRRISEKCFRKKIIKYGVSKMVVKLLANKR